MGEIIITEDVNTGTKDLIDLLSKGVKQFGENYATIFNQQEIADKLGKSVRTIYRQVESLRTKGIVEVETRRGRNGGTVIVFNKEYVRFESHKDNPITGETKTAKELRDKYYPNKGTYKPDDRTLEEKERDRIRAKRNKTINEKMNSNLKYKTYPDKEFFNMAVEPELTFKTYMISRAYNAVLLTRIETWKNQAERDGNEKSFELAEKAYRKYKHYDIMTGEFMGTQTFSNFNNLRRMLEKKGYDMMDYMSNAFDTFIYLLRQGRNARPPYVNTLYNGKTLERYEGQIKWKKDFEREHPYYAKPGDVNIASHYYPITQVIGRAYNNPMEKSMDMQTLIDAHLSNLNNTSTEQMKKAYYNTVVDKIKSGEYTDTVKKQAINFFNEKISVQMIPNMPETDYIIANLRKIKNDDDVPEGMERHTREWYAHRGSTEHTNASTPLTNKLKVKRGYLIDFSINGGATFENVWRAIEDSSSYAWNINEIQEVLKDLGDLVPLTELGDVDLEQIIEKSVPPKELESQRNLEKVFADIKSKDDSTYLEETLDNAPKMWYNVLEEVIGSSLRDGRAITKETIRG